MKHINISILLFTAILCLASAHAQELVRPAFLKEGDKIAIISPASVPDSNFVSGGIEVLRQWGLVPVLGHNVCSQNGTFAGSIVQRQSDLEWAFTDPEIKAIMCSRGGYGSIQELLRINTDIIKNNPKWLIGYSDITAIHGAIVSNGVMSIHAHMLEHLNKTKGEDESSMYLQKLLFGEMPVYCVEHQPLNKQGIASGTLVGGNLSLITSIIGSKFNFLNRTDDIILFIEDIDENLQHLNRMTYQLIASGVIDRVKGIILGDFSGYRPTDDFDTVEQMFDCIFQNYNIPICYKFPCGHTFNNFPMVEGAKVTLSVTSEGTTLQFEE